MRETREREKKKKEKMASVRGTRWEMRREKRDAAGIDESKKKKRRRDGEAEERENP